MPQNLRKMELQAAVSGEWRRPAEYAALAAMLAAWGLGWARLLVPLNLMPANWIDLSILLAGTAWVTLSLCRQVPVQNVLLVCAIILVSSAIVEAVCAKTGIPLGPVLYQEGLGPALFGWLPWPMPLLWLFVILLSRSVGRLAMRPWRKSRSYGYRLIALTISLVILFQLGLQIYGGRGQRFWLWGPTRLSFSWYGTPVTHFFSWAVLSTIILAFATPSLINKRTTKQPVDYTPLLAWLCCNVLFITSACVQHLWLAAGVIGAGFVISTIFAIRGATW